MHTDTNTVRRFQNYYHHNHHRHFHGFVLDATNRTQFMFWKKFFIEMELWI